MLDRLPARTGGSRSVPGARLRADFRALAQGGRALAAAQAKHQAGAFDAALGLVAIAESGPLDELQRAQVDLLRGEIAFVVRRGRDAPLLLLKAAKRLERLGVNLARHTYLEALSAAKHAGRLGSRDGMRR